MRANRQHLLKDPRLSESNRSTLRSVTDVARPSNPKAPICCFWPPNVAPSFARARHRFKRQESCVCACFALCFLCFHRCFTTVTSCNARKTFARFVLVFFWPFHFVTPKRVGVRTLAIGDGANDVAMLLAAHVRRRISVQHTDVVCESAADWRGRERQRRPAGRDGERLCRGAVSLPRAAAALPRPVRSVRTRFRLTASGDRSNYRRLTKVVLYSFYKNIAFVLCQFWFGTQSMFTANNLYDAYASAACTTLVGFVLLFLNVVAQTISPLRRCHC